MKNYGKCTKNPDGSYSVTKEENDFGDKIFKNEDNYRNHPTEPCYVPAGSEVMFTANDILCFCDGEAEMADKVFEELSWQYPRSCYEELLGEE